MIELLCEVLSICHKISTESDADVFFDYAPHCNYYSVYWYRDGWSENKMMEWVDMTSRITEENIELTILRLYNIAAEKGVVL